MSSADCCDAVYVVDALTLGYVQVESHRKEKESWFSRQLTSEGSSSDATQRRQLQRDNAQLRVISSLIIVTFSQVSILMHFVTPQYSIPEGRKLNKV